VSGAVLEDAARPDASGLTLLRDAAEALSYRALADEVRRAA
jgi:hypothetical protein